MRDFIIIITIFSAIANSRWLEFGIWRDLDLQIYLVFTHKKSVLELVYL